VSKVATGETASTTGATARSAKGARTRVRLLDAARTVFERDGFLTARISDITATAGLSQGSFYHYFDSKEQIFREVAVAQEARLTAPPDARAPKPGSIRDAIGDANRRYLERYRDAARLMGTIEEVSRYDEHVNAARFATMQHFVQRAERSIRGLQREGRADPKIDATFAADALGAMVARFAELMLVQHYRDYDFDNAVEQLTRLWANALGIADD
jgi:AcrR family transcriptional regulator